MNARRLTAIAAICIASSFAATAAEPVLRAAFQLPAGQEWTTVTIPFSALGWRSGSAPADEVALQAALGRLQAVEIGGRCAGWVEGATSYPCGFAVELMGTAPSNDRRFAAQAVGWEATPAGRQRTAGRSDTPEMRGSGLISPLPDKAQRVAVVVPAGVVDTAQPLRFRIRALSNRIVPSIFDRTSGEVVIRWSEAASVLAD